MEISHLLGITVLTSGPSYPCVLWADGQLIKLRWNLRPQQQCSLKEVEASPMSTNNTLSLKFQDVQLALGTLQKLIRRTATST